MSGGARVSIPTNLRKTIQDIKEIAGDHSDEDILAVLKECKMDPNETAQKLLYLDTFHEVKRKRDRRKRNTSNQSAEEYKWTPGMQWRGARGGRGNFSLTNVSNDAGRRKQMSLKQENGVKYSTERSARGSLPVIAQPEKNAVPPVKSSSASSATEPTISNGLSNPGSFTQVAAKKVGDVSITSVVDVSKLGKLPSVALKQQFQYLNPGPTPTSTPTFSPGRAKDGNSKSIPSDLMISLASASASGVYSSASDPVLMPSLNPRNPGVVGTIKREIGTQRIGNEAQSESDLNAVQGILKNGLPASGTITSTHKIGKTESQGVGKSRLAQSSKPLTLIQDEPQAIVTNPESSQPEEVLASKSGTLASEAPISSVPKLNDNVSEQLDMKLEKLKISAHQPVILPNHLQVPEAFKTGLTFGSLDAPIEHSMNSSNDKPVPINDKTSRESSMSHQAPSLAAQEVSHPDNSESHQHVSENVPPAEDNTSSSVAKTIDQSKQDVPLPFGGSQFSLIQTPEYSFGIVPQVLSPHLVQFEGSDQQGGNSQAQSSSGSTAPPVSQPMGIGQSSVAISPQLFPFLRQPYGSNYFPYNPYLPPFYMPQSTHQFLGPSGFAQQPTTANIYMSPPSPGVKFPVPPLYKPAAITGNLAHYGVPAGYSSYGSSVGYGASEAPTSGGSTSNEELAAIQLNEKNIYSTIKQNEEPHVWTSATGRDVSMLPASYFYNLPQGQQVAFSPAHSTHGSFSSIYHPSQSVATPSNIQSLPQQTQAVGGSVDALPPSGAHQQVQPQINWNSTFLNRENI